jgi:predicted RND superfamily exporter protein
LISTALVFRLKLDLNLFSLLPSHNPNVRSFFQVAEEIGFQSLLIASVEMPENYGPVQCESLVELFAEQLRQNRWVDEVEYKTDTRRLSDLFTAFLQVFPLFLNEKDRARLVAKLSEKGIREQVLANKRWLMTPFGIGDRYLLYEDPLSLREFLLSHVKTSYANRRIGSGSGYYRADAENTYFLFVKAKNPPQDLAFSKQLMADMHEITKRTKAAWAGLTKTAGDNISISYTGGYPIAVNDEATTKKDIKTTLLTSFLGVMALFGLAFRSKRIILYVGIPLTMSVLWTFGFVSLIFQRLNLLTCIFSCVLIGLGVDFAIHIVNRYFDRRMLGQNPCERLRITFQEAGSGIVVGGISTAAAFYALTISDFRGFIELGIMTGTGILICLLVMMLVFPSLLVFFSQRQAAEKATVMAGFALVPVMNFFRHHPRRIVLLAVTIAGLLGWQGTKITFDDNLKHFRSADDETLRLQDKITGWLGGSTSSVLLLAKGQTEEQALETSYSILKALDKLVDTGKIVGIKSISQYFPLPSRQQANLAFIHQHSDIFSGKRIKRIFDQALKENGFAMSNRYDGYFEKLAQAFSINEVILPSSIQQPELQKLIKPFVLQNTDGVKIVTYLQPPADLWSLADTLRFKKMIVEAMAANGIARDRYDLTGANLLTGELKFLIIENVKSALWLTSLGVIFVLVVYYRSLKLCFLSLLPLLTGFAGLAGIMVVCGQKFNLLNVMVLPMIIGIGIDDGVHLVNDYRLYRPSDVLAALTKTGRAVVLTSLTTIVGFGSIALSHYPGLRSMGYVAVIGIAVCLLSSIVVMPAVFSIIQDFKKILSMERDSECQ